MLKKRGLAVILAIMLVVGINPGWVTPSGVVHAAPADFAGGDGTVGSPYQIATAAQLDAVRDHRNEHFVLVASVDMSLFGLWEPIGDDSMPFGGVLDGQNHTISGLSVHITAAGQPAGLFGEIGPGGQVSNLQIEAADIRGLDRTGILAGMSQGTVEQVRVSGSVQSERQTGGLVGVNKGGQITKSAAHGQVSGIDSVGGLVGHNENLGEIRESYASSKVVGHEYVGGLIGYQALGGVYNIIGTLLGIKDHTPHLSPFIH